MAGGTDGSGAAAVSRRDVRRTYERIASHFARTRPTAWPEVESFITRHRGDFGLDIGIGNGRHAEPLAAACRRVVGIDLSHAALGEADRRARENGMAVDLVAADAALLPIGRDRIDLAVYVATLHHLPTRTLRRRSLNELARVLVPDGRALVGVWSVSHESFDAAAGFDTTVDWTLPDGTAVDRFYHIYDADEFVADLSAGGLHCVRAFEAKGNYYAVVAPEQ